MSASIAYVLSTRPLSGALIEEAATKGVAIDVVPFIGTTWLQDETLAKRLGELVSLPLTAIFTSTNAVTSVESAVTATGSTARAHWKIFCISGATRRAVANRFGEAAIVATADSARDLAEAIIRHKTPGECWFFCGDKRREELPETLEEAGWRVHEVVVYETILTPHRIDKSYDAILFFSPSAVESFFSINAIGPRVRLFAIGKTTAAALSTKCINPVIVSEKPDEQILIKQVIDEHTQK